MGEVASRVHVSMLIDRSGSMAGIRKDTSGGINEFLRKQKLKPEGLTVGIYEFDTEFTEVCPPIPVAEIKTYELHPRGNTALYDSAWEAIEKTGAFLSSIPEQERPDKVVFVIVTDGEENSSQRVGLEALRRKIEEQTNVYKWEFVFMGANIDAFHGARSLGIPKGVQFTASARSVGAVYNALNCAISNSRDTGATVASNMMGSYEDEPPSVSSSRSGGRGIRLFKPEEFGEEK